MKIKELIIEGFKSYPTRTVLKNFDPQFNALTGENGTGKSNILEAIFFVLGFSLANAKVARVKDKKDLIYKKGLGQIKEAKVKIIFCNRNKQKSPLGYENVDELIIERTFSVDCKSKFKINKVKKTNAQVKEIFKSIRLNVDNYSTFFV